MAHIEWDARMKNGNMDGRGVAKGCGAGKTWGKSGN